MDSGSLRVLATLACPTGLPTTEITFANQAKAAGYKTAIVGKVKGTEIIKFHAPLITPNGDKIALD